MKYVTARQGDARHILARVHPVAKKQHGRGARRNALQHDFDEFCLRTFFSRPFGHDGSNHGAQLAVVFIKRFSRKVPSDDNRIPLDNNRALVVSHLHEYIIIARFAEPLQTNGAFFCFRQLLGESIFVHVAVFADIKITRSTREHLYALHGHSANIAGVQMRHRKRLQRVPVSANARPIIKTMCGFHRANVAFQLELAFNEQVSHKIFVAPRSREINHAIRETN